MNERTSLIDALRNAGIDAKVAEDVLDGQVIQAFWIEERHCVLLSFENIRLKFCNWMKKKFSMDLFNEACLVDLDLMDSHCLFIRDEDSSKTIEIETNSFYRFLEKSKMNGQKIDFFYS